MNNFVEPQKYITYRNYKKYNKEDVYHKIIKDERHIQILKSTDSSVCTKTTYRYG